MEDINLNNFKIDSVTNSLFNLTAKIDVLKDGDNTYFKLSVTDNRETFDFKFNALEDIFKFIQNIFNKGFTIDKVLEKYNEMYSNNDFKFSSEIETFKNEKILLSPDEVDQIIVEYFNSEDYKLSIKKDMYIDNEGIPQINFYLVEHLSYDDRKNFECKLGENDLQKALGSYAKSYECELVEFKYMGGVHRTGFYVDEDTPYYEGIQLNVKKKEKINAKRFKK